MKLFNFLKKGTRFITAKHYRKNVSEQIRLNRKTLSLLSKHEIDSNSLLKLEFFFYTNKQEKTIKLAGDLRKLNYEIDKVRPAKIDEKTWALSGWTNHLKMDSSTINSWTTQMCKLGYTVDCAFDGWRTRVKEEAGGELSVDQKKIARRNELLTFNSKKEQVKTV